MKLQIGTNQVHGIVEWDGATALPADLADQPGARVNLIVGSSRVSVSFACVVGGRDARIHVGPRNPNLLAHIRDVARWWGTIEGVTACTEAEGQAAREATLRAMYPTAECVNCVVRFPGRPLSTRMQILSLPEVAELRERLQTMRSNARHHYATAEAFGRAADRVDDDRHAEHYRTGMEDSAGRATREEREAIELQREYVALVNRHCGERGFPPIYTAADAERGAIDNGQHVDMFAAISQEK